VAVIDRMSEPPAADLAKINARLQSLPPKLADLIRLAGDALAEGNLPAAQSGLAQALAWIPSQADVLRLYGLLLVRVGNLRAAIENFEAALRVAPDDALAYSQFARVLEDAGDLVAALQLRQRAVQNVPESPMAWSDLGIHLFNHVGPEAALAALERATSLSGDYAPAWLALGNALVACDRGAEGAKAVRRAIAVEPSFGAAWLALGDLKTRAITEDEIVQLRASLRDPDLDPAERTAMEFVLAGAYEECGNYRGAFTLLVEANARRRREVGPWDVHAFRQRIQQGRDVFALNEARAEDLTLGKDAILIVGMPRSGSTLVEQILASHPDVQALGELGHLAKVLTDESARRQRQYPAWVPDASAADWQRLGKRYLELVAPHRDGHPRFTDKMLNNWQALGALRAMLPAAHIVICRRNPLENCWSCFKQYFARGWQFTCDFSDLGSFWRAFNDVANDWTARAPSYVRAQGYEALTERPSAEITDLLSFCDIRFDVACLEPHRSRRRIDTLSAEQVRQPIHRARAVAVAYGNLLDPLRTALRMPDAPAGATG
jgi:tetratricopeptide (TPR) repeat protein